MSFNGREQVNTEWRELLNGNFFFFTILPGFFPGNLLEKEEKVIIQYDILFEYVNQ